MIRIQSGFLKGMSLPTPDPHLVRPTTSKVRSAIMNILQKDLSGSTFLDLFAGSGAMGFEAYSRGATHVVFLDQNPTLIKSISNWISQKVPHHSSNFTASVGDCLRFFDNPSTLPSSPIIFLDPPYSYPNWSNLLKTIAKNDIVGDNFLLVLEYHHKDPLPWGAVPDWGCQILSQHIYGETGVSLLVPSVR